VLFLNEKLMPPIRIKMRITTRLDLVGGADETAPMQQYPSILRL
jgi:hypothetical protein